MSRIQIQMKRLSYNNVIYAGDQIILILEISIILLIPIIISFVLKMADQKFISLFFICLLLLLSLTPSIEVSIDSSFLSGTYFFMFDVVNGVIFP